MSQTEYANPPITEAVVEIIFNVALDDSDLEKISGRLQKFYPELKITNDVQVMLNLKDQSSIKTEKFPKREFSTADKTEAVVLKAKSIIVSQRAPYRNWELFSARVKRDIALITGGPSLPKSDRIGMRYINRIDIQESGPVIEESHYLKIFVAHPPEFALFAEYSLSFSMLAEDLNGAITVRSGLVESPLVDHRSVLLDIDVFSDREIPQRLDKIEPLLDLMNGRARATFEACITDKCRSLFRV